MLCEVARWHYYEFMNYCGYGILVNSVYSVLDKYAEALV